MSRLWSCRDCRVPPETPAGESRIGEGNSGPERDASARQSRSAADWGGKRSPGRGGAKGAQALEKGGPAGGAGRDSALGAISTMDSSPWLQRRLQDLGQLPRVREGEHADPKVMPITAPLKRGIWKYVMSWWTAAHLHAISIMSISCL